jgi:penicillin-binding protein 2
MRRPRLLIALVAFALMASACGPATPTPTPYPSGAVPAPADQAQHVVDEFAAAWKEGDYGAMWALLAPADQAAHPEKQLADLYAQFADLTRMTELTAVTGTPQPIALAPEPRPVDLPAPTSSPTPAPSGSPSGSQPAATSAPEPSGTPPVLPGPVPGLGVPLRASVHSEVFGDVDLERQIPLTEGANGWQVRWSPALLFPELADAGTLKLKRTLPVRGRIVSVSGTVFAQTRKDGSRVYPKEWLAGQTIGYVGEVTAEDLETLAAKGYRTGDVVGRSGLEYGAEDLLRGQPGFVLSAVPAVGDPVAVVERTMVPGADVEITLRPGLQAAAEAGLRSHPNGATVALDPATGDVWAMASAPAFNPNSMTIGKTLDGVALARASAAQRLNRAVQATYPAGSSFKPFTLAAALKTGVATPRSRVPCPPTWPFSSDFTAHNYKDHSLPGLVTLVQAMAFSCNTTYMPLSLEVYRKDPTALTELLHEFGFGELSGIQHLVEESGVVPDDAYLSKLDPPREYGAFDQIQLAIGQGLYVGTPLQLANAYAAIANGGTRWVPRLVIRATLPDGTVVETIDPTVKTKVSLKKSDLDYITESLKGVVDLSYGTGFPAFRGFGIPVAGKSGTAETGTPDPHALFPAFAPADDPQIAVATVLAYVPLGTGGDRAAPLVRQVLARFFSDR